MRRVPMLHCPQCRIPQYAAAGYVEKPACVVCESPLGGTAYTTGRRAKTLPWGDDGGRAVRDDDFTARKARAGFPSPTPAAKYPSH
jgi:hypothetical protein